MSTPTVTPIVTQSWIHAHAARLERMAIVAMVLLAGSWGISKFLDSRAAKADQRVAVAEAVLSAQQAANTQFAAQTASVLVQYQAMVQALAAQNSALQATVAQRQVVLTKQVTSDATLGLPELAQRVQTLGNVPSGQVSLSGDSVNISHPGLTAIAQQLEQVPVLQADLKDTQGALSTTQVALGAADKVISSQTTQIVGLNLAATDADKVCKLEIAATKAAGRKSKWKIFKLGFILGFASGAYVGHVL